MLLLVMLLLLALVCWVYLNSVYSYWKFRNIPTPNFRYIFGNLSQVPFFKRNLGLTIADIYNEFNGYNYVGYYHFMRKGLVIRDPEIIKNILVKDFHHFHNNDFHVEKSADPLFGGNPFLSRGAEWKRVRTDITSHLSSSKLREMVPSIERNGDKLTNFILQHNGKCLEIKYVMAKFTGENLASCVFGLEGNCFNDDDSDFTKVTEEMFSGDLINSLQQFLIFVLPTVGDFLRVREKTTNRIRNIIMQTLNYRQANNIRRNDFFQSMMDMRERVNDEERFGMDNLIVHCGAFFIDGQETTSAVLSCAIYHLASNRHVQEKLRHEINAVLQKHGKITYDVLKEMTYLDCVFKESLRLHPILLSFSKLCTKTYTLPNSKEDGSGCELVIEPGTVIAIPVYGLHMDEKYFPDPNKFIPQRFLDENKANIPKCSFLPFSDGPRMCFGSKYGILNSKLGIISVIKNFDIQVNEKTSEPLSINSRYPMLAISDGIYLDFIKL